MVAVNNAITRACSAIVANPTELGPRTLLETYNIQAACFRHFRDNNKEALTPLVSLVGWDHITLLEPNPINTAAVKNLLKTTHQRLYDQDLDAATPPNVKEQDTPVWTQKGNRNKALKNLQRHLPSAPSPLDSLAHPETSLKTSSPKDTAAALNLHWQQVFSKRITPLKAPEIREKWLRNRRTIPTNRDAWIPSLDDALQAVKISGNSAAGPNGIPYEAYKAVPDLSAKVLLDLTLDLLEKGTAALSGSPIEHNFNEAWLIALGKTPSIDDATHGPLFLPSDTRPLSIVNTYNRLVSTILRL